MPSTFIDSREILPSGLLPAATGLELTTSILEVGEADAINLIVGFRGGYWANAYVRPQYSFRSREKDANGGYISADQVSHTWVDGTVTEWNTTLHFNDLFLDRHRLTNPGSGTISKSHMDYNSPGTYAMRFKVGVVGSVDGDDPGEASIIAARALRRAGPHHTSQ